MVVAIRGSSWSSEKMPASIAGVMIVDGPSSPFRLPLGGREKMEHSSKAASSLVMPGRSKAVIVT